MSGKYVISCHADGAHTSHSTSLPALGNSQKFGFCIL